MRGCKCPGLSLTTASALSARADPASAWRHSARVIVLEFHASSGGDSDEGWDFSGSIRRPKNHLREHPWVKFDKIIAVRTCRLDDWCAETGIEEVDFIWMDVQGAEGDVIKGATRTLEKTRFLYTEYSNNELYAGQPSLKVLLAILPSFKIVAKYGRPGDGDVLLRNAKRP
jgi:FkbM family methyltransferase